MTNTVFIGFMVLVLGASLGCLGGAAKAEIALSQIIIDNAPTDSLVRDIELSNIGEDKAYIEVTVYRIKNPGVYPMDRETSKNPVELGLIATPAKIVLGGDSARLIRLIMLNQPDDREHIWRVSVVPKVGEIQDGRTGVKIVVGYEMLVIQRPKDPTFDLKMERHGKSLTVTNRGNSNVLVPSLLQCTTPGECQKGSGGRIYPGRTETWTLPIDHAVDVSLQGAGRNWMEHIL